jgi:hypothetical protein
LLAGEGVHADTLTLAPTSLPFTPTPLGASSPIQTVTLTNGSEKMSITKLSLSGTAPQDFVIEHDGCTGSDLAPGAKCSFDVSFAPGGTGARSATVTVEGATVGNPYPTLALSGVATGAPVDPLSPTVPSDPATPDLPITSSSGTDPAPRTGPARSNISIELITCKPNRRTNGHKQQCTSKLILAAQTITTPATAAHAAISRGRIVYATGPATAVGPGRWELVIHKRKALRPGVYTLTLRNRDGVRRVSLRFS